MAQQNATQLSKRIIVWRKKSDYKNPHQNFSNGIMTHFFCAVKRPQTYFAVVYKFLLQIYIFFCPESAAAGLTKQKKADILLLQSEECVDEDK